MPGLSLAFDWKKHLGERGLRISAHTLQYLDVLDSTMVAVVPWSCRTQGSRTVLHHLETGG